jgi:D12 class N6 adenine-specific DNA methyltransferase.
VKSEVINIKTPVSRVGNKTAILHILYALFPLHYGRFIDVFGGSGSVLLGKPTIDAFEVYNDFRPQPGQPVPMYEGTDDGNDP